MWLLLSCKRAGLQADVQAAVHEHMPAVCQPQVLALGYSVGRVEEMPAGASRAAGSSSKLLVRQLVRIYTPGTAVEGLLLDDQVDTPATQRLNFFVQTYCIPHMHTASTSAVYALSALAGGRWGFSPIAGRDCMVKTSYDVGCDGIAAAVGPPCRMTCHTP